MRIGRFLWLAFALFVLAILLGVVDRADGASRSEEALRAQLAAAQAQVAKLSAASSQQTRGVRQAQNVNAGKAQAAVADAQTAVTQADEANSIAVATAVAQQIRMAVQAEQLKASAEASRSSNATLQITAVIGFLSLLVTSLLKLYNDALARKETLAHRSVELDKIDGATKQAERAYTEANTVNQKIEKIGLQMKDGSRPKPQDPAAEPQN